MYCEPERVHVFLNLRLQPHQQVGRGGGEDGQSTLCRGEGNLRKIKCVVLPISANVEDKFFCVAKKIKIALIIQNQFFY